MEWLPPVEAVRPEKDWSIANYFNLPLPIEIAFAQRKIHLFRPWITLDSIFFLAVVFLTRTYCRSIVMPRYVLRVANKGQSTCAHTNTKAAHDFSPDVRATNRLIICSEYVRDDEVKQNDRASAGCRSRQCGLRQAYRSSTRRDRA